MLGWISENMLLDFTRRNKIACLSKNKSTKVATSCK
jgi:hypothetical protein